MRGVGKTFRNRCARAVTKTVCFRAVGVLYDPRFNDGVLNIPESISQLLMQLALEGFLLDPDSAGVFSEFCHINPGAGDMLFLL